MTEKTVCEHPTCYENDETTTIYKEPTDHNERGWFPVCGDHVDFRRDNVTVLMSENAGAAQVANAEILESLKAAEESLDDENVF